MIGLLLTLYVFIGGLFVGPLVVLAPKSYVDRRSLWFWQRAALMFVGWPLYVYRLARDAARGDL